MSGRSVLTDYQRGRADALRVALAYCLDYGHDRAQVAPIYDLLGDALTALSCDACNLYGVPLGAGLGRDVPRCSHPGVEREFPPIAEALARIAAERAS